MPVPTVASLCTALGQHLTPYIGFTAPDVEISAVHISELLEPNAYLGGGELLLTTGLALPSNIVGCQRYVALLIQARVSALAVGLGPVHQYPPDELVEACREAGLPLLVVPGPTPFLTISRAYWDALSRSSEQQLTDAVAAHRALVDAAAAPDPSAAILRRLARVLDGWAALLDTHGRVDQLFPVGLAEVAQTLGEEVARLEVAGVHSSASFSTADHVVVIFPLAIGNHIVGYLAAGSRRPLDASRRRVVLTAVALLSLDALRDQRLESAKQATRRCVALLVDQGYVEAARRLSAETGVSAPSREIAVLVVRGRDSADLARVVEAACPHALGVMVDRTHAWFLLPEGRMDDAELLDALRSSDSSMSAVVSDLVTLDAAGPARGRAQRVLAALQPGEFERPRGGVNGFVSQAVNQFAAEAPEVVIAALVAYLRHRGQWQQAAKSLDLHRNTLRYRVSKARELLGLDLDDPDVAAETWLTLRRRGLG